MYFVPCARKFFLVVFLAAALNVCNSENISDHELKLLRAEVREMFQHAYDGYLQHAYPLDELCPLSCRGQDTWGGYALTLIDALDTLAVIGNYSEFRRVARLVVESHANMDVDVNVSVFETNIRIVGGLLSAHLMLDIAGAELPVGWPCAGQLLDLAVDVATRLLPAFNTPTGMPYGTVNLRHGVPVNETPITCTAGVGTFLVEFGTLSRLTGNQVFERVAVRAVESLWLRQSSIGLFGNHIDVLSGKWTARDAGIGAGVDSFYEYLVKGGQLLSRPRLLRMWRAAAAAVDQHVQVAGGGGGWHLWVSMQSGRVSLPVLQSLQAFWPGVLALTGDVQGAMRSLHNYYAVWRQFGFTPEFYGVNGGGGVAVEAREGYPLRPELAESLLHVYRATRNRQLVTMARQLLVSIQHSTRTRCGYATVKNVVTHQLTDRMESFFLAETVKYLYLMFDPDNFLLNNGSSARLVRTTRGQCLLHAGGYVFNTEAHPIDPAALACCSAPPVKDLVAKLRDDLRTKDRKYWFNDTSDAMLQTPASTANITSGDTCRRPRLQDIIGSTVDGAMLSGVKTPMTDDFSALRCAQPSPLEFRMLVGNQVFQVT